MSKELWISWWENCEKALVLIVYSVIKRDIYGTKVKIKKKLKIKTKIGKEMKATQILKRNIYGAAAGIFMLAATVPSLVLPKFASAEQLQNRQIELSSAAVGQTGVTYKISFDAASSYTMRGIIVDFCDGSGSPIIGSANCSLPSGMVVGATISSFEIDSSDVSGSWSATTINGGQTLSLTNATGNAVTNGDTVEIEVSGFTNASTANSTVYARILTYDTTSISGYESDNPLSYQDHGGVAIAITPNIGVTATVQETLLFCVRGDNPTDQCGNSGSPQLPNVVLGDGDPPVLRTTNPDTGSVYYQISTNAAQGVIIRMKGTTLQSGTNDIDPIGGIASDLSSGEGFGFRTFAATSPGDADGTLTDQAPYAQGSGLWAFDATALGQTYGQAIAQSTGPVYNINKQIEFAARAAGSTPAGVYTTNLSMVAVGRY